MKMKIAPVSGIYEIREVSSNTAYVGRTCNLRKRKAQHFTALRNGYHSNKPLQAAYDASDEEAFEFTVLEYGNSDELAALEQRYLDSGDYHFNRSNDALASCGVGEAHARHVGMFSTPWGVFPSTYQAAEASGGLMSQASIWTHCKRPDVAISKQAYGNSVFLQTRYSEAVIGDTWEAIGFGFNDKNDNKQEKEEMTNVIDFPIRSENEFEDLSLSERQILICKIT
ncbi:GIY-YIG nuclease family protein [Ensifer sp. SL37]|uniref:GIY-YIG nuclease family protein n=1 Tax=Ensifer sp. SL37 TaxID=2995137 RepID=UPI0022728585|nr:GIY-YIG nuclease family protein [Ensifer sp. SL37]MCY1740385.1 GIY-YIG nuclease family protein [Ensifer sp. SL37]